MRRGRIVVGACSRSGHNWVIAMMKAWGLEPMRFENLKPSKFEDRVMRRHFRGLDSQPPVVLVVRSYLSWLASFCKFAVQRKETQQFVTKHVGWWHDLWREARRETTHIQQPIELLYDAFVEHEEYRRSICFALGGEYNEKAIDKVPGAGGGSSFTHQRVPGSKMPTRTRYRSVMGTEAEGMFLLSLRDHGYPFEWYEKHVGFNDAERAFLFELCDHTWS